jgi:hypothetical protein
MRSASYPEYVAFCERAGLVPVSIDDFTWQFWIDFCNAHGVKHSAISTEGN